MLTSLFSVDDWALKQEGTGHMNGRVESGRRKYKNTGDTDLINIKQSPCFILNL